MPHSRTSPLSDSRRWKNAGRRLSAWFGMPTVMLPAFMPTTSAPGSISATIDSSRGTMSGCDRRLTWYPEPNWFLRNSGVPNARMRPAAMMAMRSPSASASSCSSAAARVRSGNGPDRAARKATEAPCARCGLPPRRPQSGGRGPLPVAPRTMLCVVSTHTRSCLILAIMSQMRRLLNGSSPVVGSSADRGAASGRSAHAWRWQRHTSPHRAARSAGLPPATPPRSAAAASRRRGCLRAPPQRPPAAPAPAASARVRGFPPRGCTCAQRRGHRGRARIKCAQQRT